MKKRFKKRLGLEEFAGEFWHSWNYAHHIFVETMRSTITSIDFCSLIADVAEHGTQNQSKFITTFIHTLIIDNERDDL